MRIDAERTWQQAMAKKNSRWSQVKDRFRNDLMVVQHRPKFTLAAAKHYFCIGSCFARNIEEELIYRGMSVLSKAIICPRQEWPARPTGIVNKFTTTSMLNELDWLGLSEPSPDLFIEGEQGWYDLQLAPSARPVSLDRAFDRRRYLQTEYFSRIRSAEVVVLTLGLVETWFDTKTDVYLNGSPSLWQIKRYPGRFQFEKLGIEANVKALERIHARLKELAPRAKIIVTVSPVPLEFTFSGSDLIVANMYSKAVLRAAAQLFADAHENVDYFPSYEIVMFSRREAAFIDRDFRHVTDTMVAQIVECFLASCVGPLPRRFPEFNETNYLAENPHVEEAIRNGDLISGYHHWLQIHDAAV